VPNLERGIEASYEISLLIAKSGKPHSIGEELIKPALSVFVLTVLQKGSDAAAVDSISLSNDTVRHRIDEMTTNVQEQLVSKLRNKKFAVQIDELTVRGSEVLLHSYFRYVEHGQFMEEMLFCEELKTTTNAADIYAIYTKYMAESGIPLQNVICAADGAPAMMGKRKGLLKLMKDENPGMLTVHCVTHRENLVAKQLSPELHTVMKAAITYTNLIKASAKQERLFKDFCSQTDEVHVRLLTEVRWLSKGNCLDRLVELYDTLDEFLAIEMRWISYEEMKEKQNSATLLIFSENSMV